MIANAGARKCWKTVSVAMQKHTLECGRTESQEGRRKKQSGHLCSGGDQYNGMPSERGVQTVKRICCVISRSCGTPEIGLSSLFFAEVALRI